jgi:hypothetical protein
MLDSFEIRSFCFGGSQGEPNLVVHAGQDIEDVCRLQARDIGE